MVCNKWIILILKKTLKMTNRMWNMNADYIMLPIDWILKHILKAYIALYNPLTLNHILHYLVNYNTSLFFYIAQLYFVYQHVSCKNDWFMSCARPDHTRLTSHQKQWALIGDNRCKPTVTALIVLMGLQETVKENLKRKEISGETERVEGALRLF